MRTAEVERALCTLVLLAVVATFAHLTLGLGPTARRVPQVIVVLTLILLATQFLLDLVSGGLRWRRVGAETELSWVVGVPEKHRSALAAMAAGRRGKSPRGRTELRMFAWLLVLPVLIVGFGVLVAAPTFTLVYLRVRARETWLFSVGMAAVMGSLSYAVFRILLPVPLHQGQLLSWLGVGS